MKHRSCRWLGGAGLGLALLAADAAGLPFAGDAQAMADRPAVARSDAAVIPAVVVKRTTTYVVSLPKSCVRTRVGGVVLWRCGKTYYQYYNNRYVLVVIN
ncbi:hypothetical protein RB623_21015 [Mesorhizobium sp. LHD-90]|uniref:hypothetical protein n=1 Tax=Mesorhizobium sp. LHD-90 TaxID=3071414 RepID=UPI0027E15AFD|nr:hypothetical protein [Mesorhizobium sp. LHD-90]MDQ6436539.1 hypothetical protein [Mesorhizobium sp. LHD-90]